MTDDLARHILAELAEIKARLPSSAPMADRSLTRRQAADHLGIHPKTLANLTASGDVAGYRDGTRGRWKYRLTDLDRYRDEHTRADRTATDHAAPIDWGA